jgi:hypothetical protein
MNLAITPNQIHILQHAIGISDKAWEYRNHYCCDVGDEDVQVLVDLGLMEDRGKVSVTSDSSCRFFMVTEEGKAAAWQHKPALKAYDVRCKGFEDAGPCIHHAMTAGKAKYDAYLTLSDVCPDVKLIDFWARRCPEMDRRDPSSAGRVLVDLS